MAKTTLHVTDKNGKRLGMLFLDVDISQDTSPLFESIAPSFEIEDGPGQSKVVKASFWQSEAINAVIIGIFVGGLILIYSLVTRHDLRLLATIAAMTTGLSVYVLRLWWQREPGSQVEPGLKENVIKVERWTDDKAHVEIDYFEDDTIKPDELSRVAAAVCENDMQWLGRRKMCKLARLSQPKYFRIRDELIRLNYLFPEAGNNTTIGLRGKSFFRQLAPYPTKTAD